MTKNEIIKHYDDFFNLHTRNILLNEDDYLNIDWAVNLVKNLTIPVVQRFLIEHENVLNNKTSTTEINAINKHEALGKFIFENPEEEWCEITDL